MRRRLHAFAAALALCTVASACGGAQEIGSRSAPAPSVPASTASTTEAPEATLPTPDDPDSQTSSTTEQPPDPGDSPDGLASGVVGRNTIEEFEAGLDFWSSAADVALGDQSKLPPRKSDTINDQSITYYKVDPALFVAATTDDDGKITGHTFSFDPSAASYLGFSSAYRLAVLPKELLFGLEVETFMADSEQDQLEKTFDDGDVLITRTGVDPLNAPIFTMSIVPSSEPSLSHDELRAAARLAGRQEGSDVTSDEAAGSQKRDVEITVCEFVDGNAHIVGEVTNNGTAVREYLVRLEVFDTNGERTIPIAFGDSELAPGASFDFDKTVDLGGGDWEICQVILLDPVYPNS